MADECLGDVFISYAKLVNSYSGCDIVNKIYVRAIIFTKKKLFLRKEQFKEFSFYSLQGFTIKHRRTGKKILNLIESRIIYISYIKK